MAQSLGSKRNQSPPGNRPNMSDLRIVLVGKNVSENNRVGNFILNKNVFVKKTPQPDVETFSEIVEGRNITVISTTHLLNPQLTLQKITQRVSAVCPPEPHVIILVLQHKDFSEKDRERLPSVINFFGEQAMKRTMILTTDDETFYTELKSEENEFIQEISTECGGCRLQLQNKQRSQLLQKVDEIITQKRKKRRSQSEERPNMCALRIVLLGKNVSENCKVRNSILGIDVHENEILPSLEQHNAIPVSGMVENRHVTVINTLHLLNPNISGHQITQTARECVNLSAPGPHAFILVLQHEDFTEDDMRRVKYVLKTFSEEAIKRIIVLETDVDTDSLHMLSPTEMNTAVHQFIKEFGGRHLEFEIENPEWLSEIFKRVDKILKENHEEFLTCEIYEDVISEMQSRSDDPARSEEKNKECSYHKDDKMIKPKESKRSEVNLIDIRGWSRSILSANSSKKQKLNLVLCGSSGTLKVSVSKLLRGKPIKPTHERASSEECVKREEKIHGRVISLVELPALNRLSEEEVMRQTLCCVSLCDPGVHVFLIIIPAGPLTNDEKVEFGKIRNSFYSKKHFIVIFINDATGNICVADFVKSSPESQSLIGLCGGQYCVMGLNEPASLRPIPELLDYIENMKTEPYSLQVCMKTQENRVRCELEEKYKEDLKRMEDENKLKQNTQSYVSVNVSGKQKLNLVLCGRDTTLKLSVSKLLRGKLIKPSYQRESSEECVKREETIHGRVLSLVELPAVNQLSEVDLKSATLNCVSLCDPGVHVFLLIVPVGPLTDEDKVEIEKIQKIFYSREHFILLFTTELTVEEHVTDFVKSSIESQRLFSHSGGQYRVMGLKEPENSRQIPELLFYIEKMKTEPYSLQMYVKAQENRAKHELEEQHEKELSEMESKIKELQQQIQSEGTEGESDDLERLRIVLIGKTGNGKSATGNTILGQEEFESESSTDSVTTVCMKGVGEVDGRSVAVVDTPGLFDTTLSNEKSVEEIMKCVSLSSPGPHVFVIVLSLGRFTKEETDTVDLIKKIFGHKAAHFSIVLFTRGDELRGKSIEDYVKRSKNAELKKLISDCGNRFLVFNNNEKQDKTQVTQLLNMIEELKNTNEGRYFTNSMFEEAEMSIKKRMEEIMKDREREIQAQHEKLRVKYETEMEELKKRLEEEKRKADKERMRRENEFRQKEEKLIKDFEEKNKMEQQKQKMDNQKRFQEKKQQRAEYHKKIEEMKREIENQRLEYEKQQKEKEEEERKREEKYRQDQEKMKNEQECAIEELQMKQKEETKRRESEERKKIVQEEEERKEWERKIKEAENGRKETQEEIKQKQREWENEKKQQMREREEEERKRKEKHEEQLREKQEELEIMIKMFQKEREEKRQKIEEEREKQRREREEKEKEYEGKKTEMERHYQQLEQERKEEWEKRKREEDERREEETKRWKKIIEDLKLNREEEIKRREKEEKERKEREEKERDEMKQKHEKEIKDIKKKHEDEARKQAEELNDSRERKEELKQMLDDRQKQHTLLENLFQHFKDEKENELIKLQHEVTQLCQRLQVQMEKEINELKKQAEALNDHLKDQKGGKIDALKQEVEQLIQSLQDQKGDKIKELQNEAEKLNQRLQAKKEEHLNNLKKEAEEMNKSGGSSCVLL